ncbi:hypothetical protein [Desulfosudis oleivorans]|uniref:Uncharacterized protein n=1 Tax=Desulfosudis oleivorans (strain DSM 6200 / JCM 39069 / Hxd3) TaxID=96561 RepID=A8ZZT4_DESOH|nr:hypothetical protein [Desulfosudis oleivorans]ABW67334.1 hypothetical protein Dole_1530 [Desulfosudis oleivorans Hxd3]
MTKKFKQNCVCKHCGNEGEMEITCSLIEVQAAESKKEAAEKTHTHEKVQVKGRGVCTSCGNEADMWIDF